MIAKHGEPAPRLCNKDPFALKSMVELSNMFPNAKFLLMIRDGRAVVHSIISRKVRRLSYHHHHRFISHEAAQYNNTNEH